MNLHLQIIGSILVLLALVHLIFPGYFNWKEELKSMSLINRQMMVVHTFFIALVVLLIGLLCLTSPTDLQETRLGKTISFGLAFFWCTRLIFQLFIYSPELWKGKKLETSVHILFTILWFYMTGTFLWIALN